MIARLKIDHAGPFVSVQDAGRQGFARFGVTHSGPMDRLSFEMSNYALTNQAGTPVIEISLGGLSLTCEQGSVTACVAGGHFSILLDGQKLAPWSIFTLEAGSKLQIRPGPWGSWCYLAFFGQIEAPQWLGSHSAHLGSGLCGGALVAGDQLNIDDAKTLGDAPGSFYDPNTLKPGSNLRVVLGPQDHFFTKSSLENLTLTEFELTADYDRMGVRLSGEKLEISRALDMPSEAIARGSLQVPGHGNPICLMADHQTTGGYPKIATVISTDQDVFSQLRVGDKVRFNAVSVDKAIEIARNQFKARETIKAQIDQNKISFLQKLWSHNLISGVVGREEE